MSRPDLTDPESRAAYQAELRRVGSGWRVGGIVVVILGALGAVIARSAGGGWGDLAVQAALAALAVGWALTGFGIVRRNRYHQRRMGEPG